MSYLFVGNLSKNISEKVLTDLFSECGICAVELKNHYAFVRYQTDEEANEAQKKFANTNLHGFNGRSKARVEFSKKSRVDDFLAGKLDKELTKNIGNTRNIDLKESDDENYSSKYHHKDNSRSISHNKNKNRRENRIYENSNRNNTQLNLRSNNVCFICKLPGHFAKECVLTKDTCFECGVKGHMAKECQAGIREAKALSYNRVKAVFSQQSSYKYFTHKQRFNLYKNYLQSYYK